jgi:hypothetical protein
MQVIRADRKLAGWEQVLGLGLMTPTAHNRRLARTLPTCSLLLATLRCGRLVRLLIQVQQHQAFTSPNDETRLVCDHASYMCRSATMPSTILMLSTHSPKQMLPGECPAYLQLVAGHAKVLQAGEGADVARQHQQPG